MKMKRRKAETLTEFLVAMVLFSVIMTGVFNFVANQTENAARIKNWDFFTFRTNKWLNENSKKLAEHEILADDKEPVVTINTQERGDITFWRHEYKQHKNSPLMHVAH